jgi:hypothetical protein
VSKRSFRRLAVVAGAALAVGSMAPAMAVRIDAGAGAEAEVDPTMVVNDVVNITGALPLPGLGALPIPTYTQLNGTLLTAGGLGLAGLGIGAGVANNAVNNADNIVAALDLGGLLPECGLVAVASCNTGGSGNVVIPVQVAGNHILSEGIDVAALNNPLAIVNVANGFGGFGLPLGVADVTETVFGLTGGLTGLLDVTATGDVNIIAGLLASL